MAKLEVIYRPPPNIKKGLDFITFKDKFSDLLENIATTQNNFIIHHTKCTLMMPMSLIPVLDNFALNQNVAFATHSASHTLDLIIARRKGMQITNVDFYDLAISDNIAVSFTIQTDNKPTACHEITYRMPCSIAHEELLYFR